MSPGRVILGSAEMVILVMSLSALSIEVQYKFRQGQAQNICSNVPILVSRIVAE